MDPAKLEAAAKSVNQEEIIEEVNKLPARYLKPFEKPANAATSRKRKARQKWTTADEIAAALTYRLVEKEHGRYQNVQEDRKHVNQVFAGQQRLVRSKWPQYENVPTYKPPTYQALAERLTKKSREYEAFFKDPQNTHIANVVDSISTKPFLEQDTDKTQPRKGRKVESTRQVFSKLD